MSYRVVSGELSPLCPEIAGGGVSQSIDALVEILDQQLQTWSHDELLTGKIGCSAESQSWYGWLPMTYINAMGMYHDWG